MTHEEFIKENLTVEGVKAVLVEQIDVLVAENERLRHALATVRDDLSSVSITGEELHNIVGGINDVLNPTAIADKEQR